MKIREVSPARKGGLMYLSIDAFEDFLNTLEKVVPDKVLSKEKKLALLMKTFRTCVETHKEDIRTGRGIVIGRDIQEVRYVTRVEPSKTKAKRKKKTR